jgi:hypothetical protein
VVYVVGLCRAIFVHGITWWFSLIAAYLFGLGIFEHYGKIREFINAATGRPLLPPDVPAWWVGIPFLLWIIASLAHSEAMRYWLAARVVFRAPYTVGHPLYSRLRDRDGNVVGLTGKKEIQLAKIDVANQPYRSDQGRDVAEAWAKVELFDLNSKPVISWEYPRWEENRKPGYGDHPLDHFPDEQNLRNLAANGRWHTITIAHKAIGEENAYPLRGRDQLRPDWQAEDIEIPPGEYLLRLTIYGKGLMKPAAHVVLLENGGASGSLDISATREKIGPYYVSRARKAD